MEDGVKLMLVLMYWHGADAPAYLDGLANDFQAASDLDQAARCTALAERTRRCLAAVAASRRA
jgi:hypothetical protein